MVQGRQLTNNTNKRPAPFTTDYKVFRAPGCVVHLVFVQARSCVHFHFHRSLKVQYTSMAPSTSPTRARSEVYPSFTARTHSSIAMSHAHSLRPIITYTQTSPTTPSKWPRRRCSIKTSSSPLSHALPLPHLTHTAPSATTRTVSSDQVIRELMRGWRRVLGCIEWGRGWMVDGRISRKLVIGGMLFGRSGL